MIQRIKNIFEQNNRCSSDMRFSPRDQTQLPELEQKKLIWS
jgi:hypothetical protein